MTKDSMFKHTMQLLLGIKPIIRFSTPPGSIGLNVLRMRNGPLGSNKLLFSFKKIGYLLFFHV